MHPELFHWGVLHIRSYGVMLAVAFLAGTWLALREAHRLSLDEDKVVNVILVVLVSSVLGARALYVMEHIQEFRREWGSVIALWQGGLTLYGGVIAGTAAGLIAARRFGLPMWTVADALTPSLALGTCFGRIGCFLNGCCYGKPTRLPWGVVFPADSFAGLEFGNAPVHPSQLYFAAAGLLLFALAWALRRRFAVPGTLFWMFIALFAFIRIPLDMTRAYEPEATIMKLGLLDVTESQLTSLAIALFSVLMILRLRRAAPARV
ncbi:MAG: prolipoprotein diacylglyceryl transferase [Candidatus Eisenbacteria bacterium]|uniref:Phosphatidylglycerol--prolipoprotein diacylglyceryl transferase n=1 Tax=Eiseniibacteriota bacterium TaxID=2212470 RepID=A0A9D6L9Z3_UNCEI|nr:prolipoprotein diacylglyceryl transferase [Candidatus Eisenbacteria bacterium]MBI3540315.1 prolipoprotein diacylglyceryl transferase [Candidatus Eisenbacteria bacterium]